MIFFDLEFNNCGATVPAAAIKADFFAKLLLDNFLELFIVWLGFIEFVVNKLLK
ncbi:hypothetical protein GCM10022259_19200 [Aquimarina mytili]